MGAMGWSNDQHGASALHSYYPLISAADKSESDRQSEMHQMHCCLQPELLPGFALRWLTSMIHSGSDCRVLDVGCGGGDWCRAFASQYPHVAVVGLDIAVPRDHQYYQNCTLLRRDVLEGLQVPSCSFEVIHVRDFGIAMPTEYMSWFLSQLYDALVPGGILVWIDQQWTCSSAAFNEYEGALEYCLNQKGMTIRSAATAAAAIHDSGLFNLVGESGRSCAVHLNHQGTCAESCAAAATAQLCRAFRPLLLERGYEARDADIFISRAVKAVKQGEESILWHYVEAQRR